MADFTRIHTRALAAHLFDLDTPLLGLKSIMVLQVWDQHTEFAVGLDWSSLSEGMLASTGWDGQAFVWHMRSDPRAQ